MHALDQYFAEHYFTTKQLAEAGGISVLEMQALIHQQLLPAPSYVVTDNATATSFAMGTMAAKGARNGEYFHKSMLIWLQRALRIIDRVGRAQAPAQFKTEFADEIVSALKEKHISLWPMPDCFASDSSAIVTGLHKRIDNFWLYFLNGTFGLCVAKPDTAAAIVHKEIVQEKLTALSANGEHGGANETDAREILALSAEYAAAAMPFSPVDYPRSSRKRLVDDLRANIYRDYPTLRAAAGPT